MAKRNFEKAVDDVFAKVPDNYFLNGDELMELVAIAKKRDFYDAITKAFCAGIQAGNRATLKHNLKRF